MIIILLSGNNAFLDCPLICNGFSDNTVQRIIYDNTLLQSADCSSSYPFLGSNSLGPIGIREVWASSDCGGGLTRPNSIDAFVTNVCVKTSNGGSEMFVLHLLVLVFLHLFQILQLIHLIIVNLLQMLLFLIVFYL